MANLAIKGHKTRGSEVIALLEMLGGNNKYDLRGNEDEWFVLNGKQIQRSDRLFAEKGFTLEQFLEKFPYKVGDKVTHLDYESPLEIVGMKWENDSIKYEVYTNDYGYWFSVDELQPYKEQETKEETVEENIKEKCDLINFNSHYIFDFADRVELVLKDNWEVKNEDGRTYVVRKQPQYPKTYEECYKIVYPTSKDVKLTSVNGHYWHSLQKLSHLSLCRDAYWKIAGDWKPEFRFGKKKYCIMTKDNKVIKATVEETNRILVFSTEEMRDAFYENFKGLIEQCKELL